MKQPLKAKIGKLTTPIKALDAKFGDTLFSSEQAAALALKSGKIDATIGMIVSLLTEKLNTFKTA